MSLRLEIGFGIGIGYEEWLLHDEKMGNRSGSSRGNP
jgi:hypothetical protein